MKIGKTYWPPKEIEHELEPELSGTFDYDNLPFQPEFGICMGWNNPKKMYKPFVVIHFWHWVIQIGWLL